MLYLTQNPEVQRKVHAEIDSVIGRDRPPCRDDKPRYPLPISLIFIQIAHLIHIYEYFFRMLYVEAVLNEVHRMCSLLPMSVYHSMLEDTGKDTFLFCMLLMMFAYFLSITVK